MHTAYRLVAALPLISVPRKRVSERDVNGSDCRNGNFDCHATHQELSSSRRRRDLPRLRCWAQVIAYLKH